MAEVQPEHDDDHRLQEINNLIREQVNDLDHRGLEEETTGVGIVFARTTPTPEPVEERPDDAVPGIPFLAARPFRIGPPEDTARQRALRRALISYRQYEAFVGLRVPVSHAASTHVPKSSVLTTAGSINGTVYVKWIDSSRALRTHTSWHGTPLSVDAQKKNYPNFWSRMHHLAMLPRQGMAPLHPCDQMDQDDKPAGKVHGWKLNRDYMLVHSGTASAMRRHARGSGRLFMEMISKSPVPSGELLALLSLGPLYEQWMIEHAVRKVVEARLARKFKYDLALVAIQVLAHHLVNYGAVREHGGWKPQTPVADPRNIVQQDPVTRLLLENVEVLTYPPQGRTPEQKADAAAVTFAIVRCAAQLAARRIDIDTERHVRHVNYGIGIAFFAIGLAVGAIPVPMVAASITPLLGCLETAWKNHNIKEAKIGAMDTQIKLWFNNEIVLPAREGRRVPGFVYLEDLPDRLQPDGELRYTMGNQFADALDVLLGGLLRSLDIPYT